MSITPPERIQKEFASLVDLLLSVHQRRLASIPDKVAMSVPPSAFLREFGTVSIDVGRATGKTEYIANHAGDDDFVVLHSADMTRQYLKRVGTPRAKILRGSDFSNGHANILTLGHRCHTIWVDEGWAIKNWVNFYEAAERMKTQRVVIFGSR